MALALIGLDVVGQRDGFLNVLGTVERHHDRQLLARERIFRAVAGFRHDEEALAFRQADAGHARDLFGGLGDDGGVEMAIDPNRVLELHLLFRGDDIAALMFKLGEHCAIDRVEQYDTVVRRARRREIDGLGDADLFSRIIQVGGVIDGDNGVADADAQGRGARRISGGDHRAAAGGEHAVALAHQLVGLFHRRGVDADDEIGWGAELDERGTHQVADQLVGQLRARVRRDDDRVAALNGRNTLDHWGCFRVGRRRQCADHPHRLGNLDDVSDVIFLDHANRLVVDDVEQGRAGLAEDLEILAIIIAELGFIDRVLGDHFSNIFLGDSPDHAADQLIHLFLRIVGDLLLRSARARDERSNLSVVGAFFGSRGGSSTRGYSGGGSSTRGYSIFVTP